MGKQYQAGFAIHYSFSLIKKFPTIEMYSIAKEEDKKKSVSSDWSGTGFALLDGYIATNFHVVDNAKTITIQGVNGDFSTKYSAKVIAVDKINDLAIVKINDDNFTGFGNIPYSIKTTIIDVGEDVFVLGFPLVATMGDEIKLSTGIISSKTGFQGDVSQYQISAPIQPGNSGGPLFNSTGDIVGIVSAKHIGAENVGYAIKSFYLNNLVQSSLPTNILPNKNVILSSSLSGKVKVVEDYIYMIICSSK